MTRPRYVVRWGQEWQVCTKVVEADYGQSGDREVFSAHPSTAWFCYADHADEVIPLDDSPELRAERETTAALRERVETLEAALREALPFVEDAEFLVDKAFHYGDGRTEPFEWGISVGYQQSQGVMPGKQFADDVAAFHRENREDDDGDGEFLTMANRLRALVGAKP